MSLQSFQSALAYVIRSFDPKNIKNIDDLSQKHELSSDEKAILENLINQQRVNAYSEELFNARWTIIREALEFLQPFIDFKALHELWRKNFDPLSENIVHQDLALRFVEYLVLDPVGSAFIYDNKSSFLPDLLRYIYAVFIFRHHHLPNHVLPKESALTDRYFMILNLDYDVREFFADLIELTDFTDVRLPIPPKSSIMLLFVARDEITEFRSFEIDQEVVNFLSNELKGNSISTARPACYEAFVELGLLKPEGIKRSCCDKHH